MVQTEGFTPHSPQELTMIETHHRLASTLRQIFSSVELVNALEREKAQGRAGKIAGSLVKTELVILDELGHLPFSASGGALLFYLLSKLYERSSVFGNAKMTTALFDRLTHRCHMLETSNGSYCFKASSEIAKRRGRRHQR
ncbi:putative transposase (plasmid) [Phaeobacter piscinae]|uniref:Transposase n=1 Tax=Phaeobacter piscinae TaxID=1580596 RepID=A0ABM6PIW8_9RHOB|nr:putative transposase [Phaeobacter piscinae]AUQ88330.1 putative transposase [Phaeobacter piscinae]AUR26213.1 putative transposase [Phaeobacter piscinae]